VDVVRFLLFSYIYVQFFVGKTFLYNALIRWCLAGKPDDMQNDLCHEWPQNSALQRGCVITAASTGIAGILLIGGGTVHSKFHVPNTVDSTTTPQVAYESAEANHLRAAELIIIDVLLYNYICYKSQMFIGSQYASP
jgi:hypothetical protein